MKYKLYLHWGAAQCMFSAHESFVAALKFAAQFRAWDKLVLKRPNGSLFLEFIVCFSNRSKSAMYFSPSNRLGR